MVGEVRDGETATIACQAAQTGHMVFSTLHTNDAPSALTRLLDLGIEEFLLSDSLTIVIGQRLVRVICENCKVPNPLTPEIVGQLSAFIGERDDVTFWKGEGCESCDYTGYSGRLALFEMLKITPDIKDAIAANCNALALKRRAEKQGFRSLFLDGMDKAMQGRTSIEEVFRVAPPEIDEGTEWCELPDSSEKREQVQEIAAPVTVVKPRKIIVASDDAMNVNFLVNVLDSENFNVVRMDDGTAAVKVSLEEKPDVIVVDIASSKINGLSLIAKIRNSLATRYIPIIALSGKGDGEGDLQGLEAGADHCLTKPVDSRRLLAVLNRLFSRVQLSER
jgi:type IV pilus assembly protein PilB